jgi:hypothetical protein
MGYAGRGEVSTRRMHLGHFLRGLQRLSDESGRAVTLTNQVFVPADRLVFLAGLVKLVGVAVIAHASQMRINLCKALGATRIRGLRLTLATGNKKYV